MLLKKFEKITFLLYFSMNINKNCALHEMNHCGVCCILRGGAVGVQRVTLTLVSLLWRRGG